ncbi:MAG: NifB/NifX family molybdenum-iron cluster-binding protein [Lentisphaeria bacterium]|nr:NifB/NifX family molybdenum-iron cluster-binding protein [Lentisphaeria bacterium]
MRIAITAQGPGLDAPLDRRFGRARFFVVCDTESGAVTAADNIQNLNAVQGAGVQAGGNVVALGVEAVLTGNIGPKAFATLQAGGVRVYHGADGTVGDALEAFRQGRLQEAEGPDAEAHWV